MNIEDDGTYGQTIAYICQWGKNREKTWSGTCQALYEALSKHIGIADYEVQARPVTLFKLFLYRKCGITKYDFMYDDIVYFNKHIPRELKHSRICSIQFSELDLSENVHSYIYQDLCIDYINNVVMKDDELRKYYRQNVSQYILEYREKKQKRYYESCKGIFVMGNWLKNYLVDKMGVDAKKVYCIGAGYDIPLDDFQIKQRSSNKLLFVGVDFARKGGYQLLKAFSLLREKYQKNVELFIVGPNDISNKMDGVHFVGRVNSSELIKYYEMCDVFCMPSYFEPFGKAYIEALCCGLPVLALNRFSVTDFIEDGETGYLLESDNEEVMAEKIYDLLHNQRIKDTVYNKMDYYKIYYSWDSVARRMIDFILKDEYMREDYNE